jgi:hypothetical protein
MPPEFAQHTEEVFLALGYDWDKIIELKRRHDPVESV